MKMLPKEASPSYFYSLLAFLIILISLSVAPVNSQPNKHVAMFVFGDSIFEVGNNVYIPNLPFALKTNYIPYGESFFEYPTGRSSDGRIIPDFLALYNNLPLWEPYLKPVMHNFSNGANFAGGGACVLSENCNGPITMRVQLNFYKEVVTSLRQELSEKEVKTLLMNAIYIFSFGAVDYFHFLMDNSTEAGVHRFVNLTVSSFTEIIKEIYELGGRKFVFLNVSPLARSPEGKAVNDMGIVNSKFLSTLVILHNNALAKVALELESQLSGFRYSYFDFYKILYDRILNPTTYGFKVPDIACCGIGIYNGFDCGLVEHYSLCGSPKEYVYFDGVHPTEHAYSQIAELAWNGGTDVTWPYNVKQLIELDLDPGPQIKMPLQAHHSRRKTSTYI